MKYELLVETDNYKQDMIFLAKLIEYTGLDLSKLSDDTIVYYRCNDRKIYAFKDYLITLVDNGEGWITKKFL